MLPSLPAQTLGASLSAATTGALLDVAGFLIFAAVVWAVFSVSSTTSTLAPSPPSHWGPQSYAPLQTAMTPLEVDLARVETLPIVSAVAAPSVAPVPPAPSPLADTIVEELRADMADKAPQQDQWPPAPRTPGAKVYRYVNAGGRLVKLSDLHEVMPLPPLGNMLN